MRGEGRERTGRRGGGGINEQRGRGGHDDRWTLRGPNHDPGQDLSDMYEDLKDPAGDDYIWPVHEDTEED